VSANFIQRKTRIPLKLAKRMASGLHRLIDRGVDMIKVEGQTWKRYRWQTW